MTNPMIDAMQTIRDDDIANVAGFLELSTRKVTSIQMAVSAIVSFERIRAAIDSLAVTPSEDARTEAKRYFSIAYNAHMDTQRGIADMLDSFAALIQARDERIRRECYRVAMDKMQSYLIGNIGQDEYESFILTPEATDGQ